jgi:hypothetical protein
VASCGVNVGKLLGFLGGPISDLVGAVGGVIDSLSTTKEEKLAAKAELFKLQTAFAVRLTELDGQFAAEQAKVVIAEAQSESWLTRNWRPILMLVFTYIIAHNFIIAPMFSLPSLPIPDQMWELLKLGIGGYIGGRSAEYIAEQIGKGMAAKQK